MSELAINVSADNLIYGGFLLGMTMAILGAGVRVVFGKSKGSRAKPDPEM